MARKIAAVAFSLGCLHTSSALALGLGELKLESFLNEPLKAEVALLNTKNLHEDQIRIRLATKEDFKKMGVDRAYFLTNIKFDVEIDAEGSGVILLSSEDPVLEPYLDFILEASWPSGRLLREYTVLVDPPLFDQSTPVISASEQVAVQEGVPEPEKKSQPRAVTETTGTQVDVRKSNLAPGEMPRRDFNANTVDTPVAGQRYMIHRDDTLWQIASRARPAGASVHQTMLDIQRLNPEAFIDGNINRIKAGYILYLPSGADISSSDEAAARENVRQQNEDWRAGRASTVSYTAGPALRISADDEGMDDETGVDAGSAPDSESPAAAGAPASMDEPGDSESAAGVAQQLAAMERQVETLQRIVSLKDEQIAALQAALAEAEGGAGQAGSAADGESDPAQEGATPLAAAPDGAGEATAGQSAPVPQIEEKPRPAPEPQPAAAGSSSPAQPASGGLVDYLLYGLGVLLLGLLAFLFVRRRRQAEDEGEDFRRDEPVEAVFADVKLKEQPLEVESKPPPAEPAQTDGAPAKESGTRGYGEFKHDEYAADMEAGDAIAEADIYIAYGRYNQAIDLLNSAAAAEPANPAYQLKLLEIYLQTGDAAGTEQTFSHIQAMGDEASLSRAVDMMAGPAGDDISEEEVMAAAVDGEPPAPEAADEALEIDTGAEAELELSTSTSEAAPEAAEEELMIAADSNGLSSKLDLARAYLDMGDDDGARQILEEIAAEGSEELKAEAQTLLERIG